MPRPWQPAPSFPPQPPAVDESTPILVSSPEGTVEPEAALDARLPRGRARRVLTAALVVVALGLAGATGYLYRTSNAWQDRADQYEAASAALGADLSASAQDLDGAQAQLVAVAAQLTTAQDRIVELADEKAQVGDDREAQRLVADYQARVSTAAGRVALLLDRCVKGQDQLIGYLGTPDRYPKAELDAFAAEVTASCTAATEANDALQTELGK